MTAVAELSAEFMAGTNPVGLVRDADHRYYWGGQGPITSVTTALGIIDKSGPLVGWAKREVANAAVRHLDVLTTMVTTAGAESAAKWLGTIPGYQRDTAADIGTRVHELAEAIARGQDVPVTDEERPFIDAYRRFLADWQPRFLAAEEMVCSLRHAYAGTLDAIAVIDGETWMLDNKTSKGVYPETALQLAAYGHADFIGRPGEARRFRIPRPTRYGVLHLRPDGYRLIPFEVTRDTFAAFLRALDLHRWREGEAKTVVGSALKRGVAHE